MFNLTTQSTHFYLWLYGIGKDHSDSERGNPLLSLHGLFFYDAPTTDRIAHTTATPVVDHWLERENIPYGSTSDDSSHHERALYQFLLRFLNLIFS